MTNKSVFLCILLFFSLLSQNLFGAENSSESHTPEPYNQEEFPQALKDLRRFEIISLGSMPFVMLDCNMVYSGVLYAQGKTNSFNPLSTSNYTSEQQVGLILTSLGISLGIGLTDLIVQNIKRNKVTKKAKKIKNESISVTPIEEDPDAVKIPVPQIEDSEVEVLE